MDKNWLIRTKTNHILGPISKEKVLELYNNGSIKPDDEVCSGNGFWFFVREDEMVEKYLLGSELQGFNPISEAKDVLTAQSADSTPHIENEDITLVGGINLAMLKEVATPAVAPLQTVPDVPKVPVVAQESPLIKETPVTETKKKNNLEVKAPQPKKKIRSQSYLRYIGILGFLALFLLVYFRKTIIRALFQGEMTSSTEISLISRAHAQEDVSTKKKSF